MADGEDRTAKIALWVSIASALTSVVGTGLTFYQMSEHNRELSIAAAIDISKNHGEEFDTRMGTMLASLANGQKNLSAEDAVRLARHADYIEYLALLTNTDKADLRYIARTVQCDVAYTKVALDRYASPAMTPAQRPETIKLAAKVGCLPDALK